MHTNNPWAQAQKLHMKKSGTLPVVSKSANGQSVEYIYSGVGGGMLWKSLDEWWRNEKGIYNT